MGSELIPFTDMQGMAKVMAETGMFGKTSAQLLALMLIAQAEGQHPAIAAQEYDVIQGRPALKAQAALARFQTSGGKIQWKERSDKVAEAVFSHPAGGELTVKWDMARAQAMGLASKDNWKKQPGIMLQWRCVAEGIRACYPAGLNRMYLAEEVQDFEPMRNVTEPAQAVATIPEIKETPLAPSPPAPQADNPFAERMRAAMKELGEVLSTIHDDRTPVFSEADKALVKTFIEKGEVKNSTGKPKVCEENAKFYEDRLDAQKRELQNRLADAAPKEGTVEPEAPPAEEENDPQLPIF